MNDVEIYEEKYNEINIKIDPHEDEDKDFDSESMVKKETSKEDFSSSSKIEDVYENIEIFVKEENEDYNHEDNLKSDQNAEHKSDGNDSSCDQLSSDRKNETLSESGYAESSDDAIHQANLEISQMIFDTFKGVSHPIENMYGESCSSSSSIINSVAEEIVKQQVKELSEVLCYSGTNMGNIFNCTLCEYKTNLKGNFQRHLFQHSDIKLFKCSDCSYECNQKASLQAHILIHSDTKYFKCAECNYETKWKKDLLRHLLIHSSIKMFKCSSCDYETNQKCNLKSHALTHSDTRIFKCFDCGFECKRKGNLKDHLLTHSDKKFYKCTQCPYETNWKKDLRTHKLTHTDIKLFKCLECSYGTNWKKDLKKHMLVHARREKRKKELEEEKNSNGEEKKNHNGEEKKNHNGEENINEEKDSS